MIYLSKFLRFENTNILDVNLKLGDEFGDTLFQDSF